MKKHIMVVDASKTIRNLVAFVLKGEGFKVSTAEDGLDAIEKLYKDPGPSWKGSDSGPDTPSGS